MVSIGWYLGYFKGYLGAAGGALGSGLKVQDEVRGKRRPLRVQTSGP